MGPLTDLIWDYSKATSVGSTNLISLEELERTVKRMEYTDSTYVCTESTGKRRTYEFAVPGAVKKDIEVTFEDNYLFVKSSKKHFSKSYRVHFNTSFGVKEIFTDLKDGILTVVVTSSKKEVKIHF